MVPWFLYMVRCADGSFYTGVSPDVTRRVHTHNRGVGARYTRARRPVTLVFMQEFADRATAQRAEIFCKRLPHDVKQWIAESSMMDDDNSVERQVYVPAPQAHESTCADHE